MNHTYRPKHHPIRRAIITAAALSLLVTSIPIGSTWAWFTNNQASGISAIQSASFGATITLDGVDVMDNQDGTYSADLTEGYSYTVTLIPSGTATSGYCLISTDELEAYTNDIVSAEGGYTFTIDLRETAEENEATESTEAVTVIVDEETPLGSEPGTIAFTFIPCWGTYAAPVTFGFGGAVCLENGANVNEYGEAVDPNRPVVEEVPAYEALVEHAIPLYDQNDYPDNRYGAGTIASDGCGVVSLAMIANYLTGYEYSITDLARWFGGTAENNIARFENGATTLGLPWEKAENIDKAIEALYGGKIVVMMMDGFESENPFTTSQHFIVVRGVTTDERFLVNDPNSLNYDKWELRTGFEIGFTRETLVAGYSGAWIFDTELPENFQPYVKEEAPRQDNYPDVVLTYEEQLLIAKVIWVEAQGECAEGQQAVAEVILNRLTAEGRFGDTVEEVIYAEGQFRSVPKLEEATPWQAQYDALDAALYGEPVLEKDVYFFATEALTNNVFATIGGHIFCKDGIAEPEATEPAETEPVETAPVETEPVETEPAETEPVETEPVETEPVKTEPAETEPAETEPTETEPVATEPTATEPVATEPPATEPTAETQSAEVEPHDIPNFCQSDYADIPYGDGTIGKDGSSIVSLAMTASYLTGYDYTPDALADWFSASGEDDIARLDAAISTLMLPVTKTEDLVEAATAAGENKILILRLESTEETPSIFTDEVHFIVIRGVTEDGKFLINDPCTENYEKEALQEGFENGFALEDILSACTHAWIFDPDSITEDFVPYTQ